MSTEHVDPRGQGAVRFLDAITGLPVVRPLRVRAKGVRWSRNLQGWYVIRSAPGVDAATGSLHQAPSGPPTGSTPLEVSVEDPSGHYLARRGTVPFPRDPDPARTDRADSLFRPVEIRLFRSPSAPTAPGWAVIRTSVTARATGESLPGALIRVLRDRAPRILLASGLADARGEALVAVAGIPVTTWEEGPGPVLATELKVRLEVIWDPEAEELPDPDDLEARRVKLRERTATATLASGQELVKAL